MGWMGPVVEWSTASTEPGDQCAVMDGMTEMPGLYVANLGTNKKVY